MLLPNLAELQPSVNRMQGIAQDPICHGEGDVVAHTRLVIEKLRNLPAFGALDAQGQNIMTTAAALHDLGKASCTKLEDGRWVSPHHSRVGAIRARELLMTKFGLCGTPEALRIRETVCALILWHMRPLYALSKADPERTIRQMASLSELASDFTVRRLAMLSEADCLGRISEECQARLIEVTLFSELAAEQECLDAPFRYPDAFSRYADLSGRNIVPGQRLFNDHWGTITMLSGLPGTGKDTWIRQNMPDQPVLSLDGVRREIHIAPAANQGCVIQIARERARQYLRRKQPFVFNATNISKTLRGKWIRLFHDYGASVHIVYLETPWDERERRNRERMKAVPEESVWNMLSQFELPMLTEAEEVSWICV